MICAACGSAAQDIEHHFYEGVAQLSRNAQGNPKPHREWTVTAPLYYKSTPDYTGVIEGYCSPACAVARMNVYAADFVGVQVIALPPA